MVNIDLKLIIKYELSHVVDENFDVGGELGEDAVDDGAALKELGLSFEHFNYFVAEGRTVGKDVVLEYIFENVGF
jgi:hypothetical protein